MKSTADYLKTAVIEFCSSIGADALLVQGAGGNVSWKDGDTLWVKASSTWLADAAEKDIFVPVDLSHLRAAIERGDFSASPRLCAESALRPSIETLLHALMPHRVVVHLHAIEALAYLVCDNGRAVFQKRLDPAIKWAMVDYHKPGAALAAAVSAALEQKPDLDVILLNNHGVVIGGADVSEVDNTLGMLVRDLRSVTVGAGPRALPALPPTPELCGQYVPARDSDVHQLALDNDLFNRLDSEWALYPDHVVFLGERAYAYKTWEAFKEENKSGGGQPELVFILGHGVFVRPGFNEARQAQLRCYYDVLVRRNPSSPVKTLTNVQIAELLNWEAEQYRMNLSK